MCTCCGLSLSRDELLSCSRRESRISCKITLAIIAHVVGNVCQGCRVDRSNDLWRKTHVLPCHPTDNRYAVLAMGQCRLSLHMRQSGLTPHAGTVSSQLAHTTQSPQPSSPYSTCFSPCCPSTTREHSPNKRHSSVSFAGPFCSLRTIGAARMSALD